MLSNNQDRYLFKKKSSCEFDNIEESNATFTIYQKYSIAKHNQNPFFKSIKITGLSKSMEISAHYSPCIAQYPVEDDTELLKRSMVGSSTLSPNTKFTLHFESNCNKQHNLDGDQTLPTLTATLEEIKGNLQSFATVSMISPSNDTDIQIPPEFIKQFEEIRTSIDLLIQLYNQKPSIVIFPYHDKKILVLDIDETLSHNLSETETSKLRVHSIFYKTGEYSKVVLRPYYKQFLDALSKEYSLVAFTAGCKKYSESIIRLIDPKKKYFLCELYRNDCFNVNNAFFAKDLRIIGDLSQVIIIDNNITSFVLQLDNGIRILPFYGDQTDCELVKMLEYLETIRGCPDVRVELRKKFNLSVYLEKYFRISQKVNIK